MTQIARLLAIVLALSPSLAGATLLAAGDIIVSGSGVASTGLIRVDPVTGAQTLISSGSFGDFSMLGTGTIYALSGGAVVEVDTATGNQRVVSSGGDLVAPSGIAVDGSGRVFVSDYFNMRRSAETGRSSRSIQRRGISPSSCLAASCLPTLQPLLAARTWRSCPEEI